MSIDDFAKRVKKLRSASGITLKQLSEKSGISITSLSNIENGKISPTYEKIAALVKGLNVDVTQLFGDDFYNQPTTRRSVNLKGKGVKHKTNQYVYEALFSDLINKKMIPLVTTIKTKSKSEFGSLSCHDGEEFIYILEGEVTVYTDHYSPIYLSEGDACYWDSTMGHAIISGSDQDAVVLWVSTNPSNSL